MMPISLSLVVKWDCFRRWQGNPVTRHVREEEKVISEQLKSIIRCKSENKKMKEVGDQNRQSNEYLQTQYFEK